MTDDATSQRLRAALAEHFGHRAFRGSQEAALGAVMAGRDVLLTMPTGAGKSLVYQLPAVLLEGLTVVVSPLIALMADQVDALRARGLRAAQVNSSIPAAERARRLEAAVRGELDLLFLTPERFRSPRFLELLDRLAVARLAVDEAHCISHWGHDFRPDYHRLGTYRALLGDPPTVALTATATPAVADDIVASLRLDDPLVIREGIERPNLFLACTRVEHEEEKLPLLCERIAAIDGPGIIYSTLIRDLERLHDELRRRGVGSLVYHGKLSAEERRSMQRRFMEGERELVLATNAFGMGVDKADIRFVLHAQVPRTLEAWAQEIGRAGRDGAPAWCELLYFSEDVAVQQNFVSWANPSREYLLGVYETLRGWGERVQARDLDDLRDELLVKNRGDNRVSICLKWLEVLGVVEGSFEDHSLRLARELDPGELPAFVGSEEKRRADLEALLGMVRYAGEAGECRRVGLARHFGLAEPAGSCGSCDACAAGADWRGAHFAARPASARPQDPPEIEAAFSKGDWVWVDRRHHGQVVRVEGRGRALRLVVEDAMDLRRRTIDPNRRRVERL
ncbi:MAG: RecQ family ATP-dependent DNA helicase [Planctomycetota bacterium]|jgi:ATP-dependent DNA helicase RecQ|nr:RecQ family ATP-dependent DNA helicase [Planctomycetota bacterium]MDP6762565.1 RecQ family ATP-dependent DNA helicase [Planctomycetota bacterium]MDP6990469.1 RecQ family ATP-dependent DNA helicase [Planctomycetota bacterium]